MKELTMLLTCMMILLCPAQREKKDAKVFYFPMFAETTQVINESLIEEKYDLSSVVRSEIPEIIKLLRSAAPSGHFEEDSVRLKVITGDKMVYICDMLGNVKYGGSIYRLTRENRKKLRNTILSALPRD
jgi:hypothetical protein